MKKQEKIRQLRDKGMSLRQIAKEVGLASPSTVLYHMKVKDERFYLSERELLLLWKALQETRSTNWDPETEKVYRKLRLHQFKKGK